MTTTITPAAETSELLSRWPRLYVLEHGQSCNKKEKTWKRVCVKGAMKKRSKTSQIRLGRETAWPEMFEGRNNGGSEWSSNRVNEGRGNKGGKREVRATADSNALFEFTYSGKERRLFTLSHTHMHTYTIPVWCWGLFVCWVMPTECCRCYLPMPVWPGATPWEKKHWWAGFKEPYLLSQHQKVHLGASVIFHPFPQLGLGYIMMSNSRSLILSQAASLSSSPRLSSPHQSSSLLAVSHALHWSFVALITTSLDFYKNKQPKKTIWL